MKTRVFTSISSDPCWNDFLFNVKDGTLSPWLQQAIGSIRSLKGTLLPTAHKKTQTFDSISPPKELLNHIFVYQVAGWQMPWPLARNKHLVKFKFVFLFFLFSVVSLALNNNIWIEFIVSFQIQGKNKQKIVSLSKYIGYIALYLGL